MFPLIWLKKISVLQFISFFLMLIDLLKTFRRFVKQNLLNSVTSLFYSIDANFILSYYYIFMLLIALTIYVLVMFHLLLIAISVVLQSIFLIKTSILLFTIAEGCLMRLGNIKKLTC